MDITKNWLEFLATLAKHEQETLLRAQNNIPLENRMPAQEIIDGLQDQCLDLTTLWYGKGNCSALYASFLKMSELAGLCAYKYADLPVIDSNDGYLSLFNREFRDNFIHPCPNPFTTEELCKRRVLSFKWQRNFNLQFINEENKSEVLRNSNTDEESKLCVNSLPYFPLHGLGISDYADNIVNDIEKVAYEMEYLNPATTNSMLAGEYRFMAGQNSHTGSSVPTILHSHHTACTIKDFKLYDKSEAMPHKLKKFQGTVDLIQIGSKPDALLLKMHSASVTHPEYLNFWINLRLHLERTFSNKVIDLFFNIFPTPEGEFITVLAPFAKLIRKTNLLQQTIFVNPETGENNIDAKVVEYLHLGNAGKKWGVKFSDHAMLQLCINNGEQRLRALYDFTAKHDVKSAVEDYVYAQV